MMDSLLQALRYAARTLRRSPSFTLVVTVTLALGIGANTALFSVIDALMLRKPTVADPDRLVVFTFTDDAGAAGHFAIPQLAKYTELRGVFAGVAGFQIVRRAGARVSRDRSSAESAELGSIDVAMTSPAFFPTIGVVATSGRTLTPEDDGHGGQPAMVLSDRFARRAFGSARDAVGRTVTLLSTAYTVVGVLPVTFDGPWTGGGADAWVPLALQPAVMPERPDLLTNSRVGMLMLVARLRPGATVREASDVVNAAFQNDREIPEASAVMTPQRIEAFKQVRLLVEPAAEVSTGERTRLATPLTLLIGAVTIVLLIACANVSNLLLARAGARDREIAIRIALGSGKARLLSQLFAESALLAVAGTLMGLLVAAWGADALVGLLSDPRNPLTLTVAPDARLAAFAVAVCGLTTLVFGLAPAIRLRSTSLRPAFSTFGSTTTSQQRRVAKGLMIAQLALSAVLLVGAGLFARTLHNLRASDIGFDKPNLVLARFGAEQAGYNAAETLPLYEALVSRVAALPRVRGVTASNRGLFAALEYASPVVIPGRPVLPTDDYWVNWNLVGDDFFHTTGMTLISGRAPAAADSAAAPHVVAVNEAFARKYFGAVDVVGRTFHMRRETAPPVEIVGVVRDARLEAVRESGVPMIFVPYRQDPGHLAGEICIIVRTSADLADIAPAIRRVGRDVAPRVPLVSIQTADAQIEQTLVANRATATLSVVFGTLAAFLVLVGLYGLLAYTVECRTSEIGIRGALGATRSNVIHMVLREGAALVGIGLAAGLPLAWTVARLLEGQLFGVASGDPATFVTVAVLLGAVGMASGVVPAARAARVDPMRALRRE